MFQYFRRNSVNILMSSYPVNKNLVIGILNYFCQEVQHLFFFTIYFSNESFNYTAKNQVLLKTGCNKVGATLFRVVNNIVQHCFTLLSPDSGSTILFSIVSPDSAQARQYCSALIVSPECRLIQAK